MIIYFLVPLFLFAFAYLFLNLWLALQVYLGSRRARISSSQPSLSILVCARNEELHLASCLDHLLAQDYPQDLSEIWIANDRSSDRSAQILEEYALKHPRIKVLHIDHCPPGLSPKKNALHQLIQHAQGEILLNTDADCLCPPQWASLMVQQFTPQVNMVLGRSDFAHPKQGPHLFWGFQALDFFSHGIVAAAGVCGGIPINSTGNSLAYRKSAYDQVGGLLSVSHIISGDDDLLLHKFHQFLPGTLRYCFSPGAAVQTSAPETFHEFWEQRKRWASKTVYYSLPSLILLSCVFAYYLAIVLLPWIGLLTWSPALSLAGLGLMLIKMTADSIPLLTGMKITKRLDLAKYYIPTALIHSHYIVAAASIGVLGKFTWKDGQIGRQN